MSEDGPFSSRIDDSCVLRRFDFASEERERAEESKVSMKLSRFDEGNSTFAYLIGTIRIWVESLIRRSERNFGLSVMKHVVEGSKRRKASCGRAVAGAASQPPGSRKQRARTWGGIGGFVGREKERENLKMGDERVTPERGSQKSSLNTTKHSLLFEAKREK